VLEPPQDLLDRVRQAEAESGLAEQGGVATDVSET
jgi:hypothetical protein